MVKKITLACICLLVGCTIFFTLSNKPNGNLNHHLIKSRAEIDRKVRPGDIILVRGSTSIDRIIKAVTGGVYTHVAGVVKSDEAVDILPFTKAGYKNLWTYAGKADVFTCDTLTGKQRKKIVDYVRRKIGTQYDYTLVIWEASRYIFHWEWPYQTNQGNLCSTLWADAYRQAGVDLCPDISFPSPVDLAKSPVLRKVVSY